MTDVERTEASTRRWWRIAYVLVVASWLVAVALLVAAIWTTP